MTSLEKYLVMAKHTKLTKEALEEMEVLYDKMVSSADAFYKDLNELDARYATGSYGERRVTIEVTGLNAESRLGATFDVDPIKGPDFNDIKEWLSKITVGECMLVDEKTVIIATYNANTKTLS